MRNVGKVALLLLAVCGGTLARAGPMPYGSDKTLRAANEVEVAAFLKADPGALAHLWSADFLVTNPLNQVATKDQVLAMIKAGTLSFKSYDRRIEYIRHYGALAVVIGSERVEWTGRMPLAGQPRELRFTALWQASGSGWTELIRHANVIPVVSKR